MSNKNWKNPVSDNWNTPADWDTGTVPVAGDDVIIGVAGGYTVTLTTPITVNSITISDPSATLSIVDPGGTEQLTGALTNSGTLYVDAFGGQGGTSLAIGGALTNSNTVFIGNGGASGASTVTAAALVNTGNVTLGSNGSNLATLSIAGAAGFGTAGMLTGNVRLLGDALLEFGSGQITSIAGGASLEISGSGRSKPRR
jgi:hypothetical protein